MNTLVFLLWCELHILKRYIEYFTADHLKINLNINQRYPYGLFLPSAVAYSCEPPGSKC